MEYIMDHIVLNIEDDQKMIDFYTNVLMMVPERLEEYHAGTVSFPSVRLNRNTIIDFFPRGMWDDGTGGGPGRVNLNHFCMTVNKEEQDEIATRLEEYSIPIEEGPVPRWGAAGVGTSIYFRDPENNLIEIRYYGKN